MLDVVYLSENGYISGTVMVLDVPLLFSFFKQQMKMPFENANKYFGDFNARKSY